MPLNHTSEYAELTDVQFALVGKLVVEWSNIDQLVAMLLSRLLLTSSFLARVYTDELSGSRRQAAVAKALDIHEHRYSHRLVSAELATEVRSTMAEVEVVRGHRNRLAHYCWTRSTDDELFGTRFSGAVLGSKAARRDTVVVSMVELDDLYQRSYGIVERLQVLITQLPETDEDMLLRAALDPSV
jgi:hypothetical protein